MHMRRLGSASLTGQLYETKLLSLLYFRAFHDHTIEDFQIAANVDNIGQFNDICFKFKVKEFDKPVAVFIQAKHRKNRTIEFICNLARYFDSYCKIREKFKPANNDSFFCGTFDETECLFVIYGNTTLDPLMHINHSVESGFSTTLYNLIGTGGQVMQSCKNDENIELLCKMLMKEQITTLAERIANFINTDFNFQMMVTDDIVLRFHVILARQVFNVSEIQPDGHRIASFRDDFFDTREEYLMLFKDKLIQEVLRRRKKGSTDINNLLSEFLEDPTNATKLSKHIGNVKMVHNNGMIEINKQFRDCSRPHLQVYVPQLTVYQAVELAAKQILLSFKLRVPPAFGNKDLTIRGSEGRIEKRVNHLTDAIINLLEECRSGKVVTIHESMAYGFLRLDGGIAGAIGNIFVLDDNELMKVTDNGEQLGPFSKMLYTKLNSRIDNLHEYKFYFKSYKFPKMSFGCNNYEKNLVLDFLNRFLFYTRQADELGVERCLKNEIEHYQSNQPNYFQAKTDAIFSSFHDKIQKWWMLHGGAPYLTRNFNVFQESINNIIKDPLMSSINLTYMSKINQYNYTFTEDAVSSLNLLYDSGIIITENIILTVVKVLQYLENKDHVVLDFEYITHLPINDRNGLYTELSYTDEKKVLILVYDKTNSKHDMKHLEKIAQAVHRNQTIVVTNQMSFETIKEYFPEVDIVIQDKKLSLIDLSVESQMNIIENATAMFPGVEMKLDLLLKGWSKSGSRLSCVTGTRAQQQPDDDGASTSHETGLTGTPFTSPCPELEGPVFRQTGEEETTASGMRSDPLSGP